MVNILLVLAFSMVANGVSDATLAEVTIHSSDDVDCSGTIISDNWIITAAHCTSSSPGDNVQVVINVQESTNTLTIGENLQESTYTLPREETFKVDLIKKRHGVAPIRTKDTLPLEHIVKLADDNDDFVGQICRSVGLGSNVDGTIISPEQCRSSPNERIQEVCFEPRTNGAGACARGYNALRCDGKLAGVSSSGNGRCPRRFTRISRLLTWIRSEIENN